MSEGRPVRIGEWRSDVWMFMSNREGNRQGEDVDQVNKEKLKKELADVLYSVFLVINKYDLNGLVISTLNPSVKPISGIRFMRARDSFWHHFYREYRGAFRSLRIIVYTYKINNQIYIVHMSSNI